MWKKLSFNYGCQIEGGNPNFIMKKQIKSQYLVQINSQIYIKQS